MKKRQSSSKLNRKVLDQMTATAQPMERDKPRLHLTGPEAKAVHKMKPGAKVKMTVHGKVTSMGLAQWGPDKGQPEADVEIHGMKMMKGKGKTGMKDMEGKMEDKKAEGVEE